MERGNARWGGSFGGWGISLAEERNLGGICMIRVVFGRPSRANIT